MALSDRPFGPSPSNPTGLSTTTLNTQVALNQGVLPALQAIITTAETKILNPLISTLALAIPLPPSMPSLEQTLIDVWVSGYIKTTASGTIALALYGDALTTVTSGNLLHKTASAVTQNTATAPFWFGGKLIYDSVSGKLTGKLGGSINNTLDAEIAVSNVLTGISNTSDPVLNLSLSITSSGAGSSTPTTINVQKFSVG